MKTRWALQGLWIWVLSFTVVTVQLVDGHKFHPLSFKEKVGAAACICSGQVVSLESYRDAEDLQIYTEAVILVEAQLKGVFPKYVKVSHRGGTVDGKGFYPSLSPNFRVGERRVFFLARRPDGTLFAPRGDVSTIRIPGGTYGDDIISLLSKIYLQVGKSGKLGANVTNQAGQGTPVAIPAGNGGPDPKDGLIQDSNNIPRRFLPPDRGLPISVVVDQQTIPGGNIDVILGLTNALQVWEAASTVMFVIEDTTANFGVAPDDPGLLGGAEGKIFVQMHDTFSALGDGTLGVGGGAAIQLGAAGGAGGLVNNVDGNVDFNRTDAGFVILNHSESFLQTQLGLEEVLAHEIGHALGLAHSSDVENEMNTELSGAIMFFQASATAVGPALGNYDIQIIPKVHPANTPPYGHDRSLRAVTSSNALQNNEVNQVSIEGFDLQNDTLTLQQPFVEVPNPGNGNFDVSAMIATFAPTNFNQNIAGNTLASGSTGSSGKLRYRYSDGTNLSPFIDVNVVAFLLDTQPAATPDGLPDGWMVKFFFSNTPESGTSEPGDDPDLDGMSNLDEFRVGTDPTDPNSRFTITSFDGDRLQWTGRQFDIFGDPGTGANAQWIPNEEAGRSRPF